MNEIFKFAEDDIFRLLKRKKECQRSQIQNFSRSFRQLKKEEQDELIKILEINSFLKIENHGKLIVSNIYETIDELHFTDESDAHNYAMKKADEAYSIALEFALKRIV